MGTQAREQVAAEVRAAIARKGVTATMVAAATDIAPATLSRRLNAAGPFTVDELDAIARYLGVETRDFFPRLRQAVAA
ncbi:helix-turn-helix transcriptional regulator [Galbitalea sp. SE-J8]|uniref:helix-turn-helix domain-containing protein n=1 Tax=Galbitalea sp. SE-J8 TaxID=3054952 RepID=UPI00259D08DD|nr:helix-turn-helix transcriptional regulator [Galbitalea sp. SE-J8]MDM4761929.1 helix-turn-helix transcriptional regulator [Galbitalea sp. SE-J8]